MKKLKRNWIRLVKLLGWRLLLPEEGTRSEMERCIFVVAPHTSAFDFIIGATYLWSCCSNGKVFIKKEFFRWPLGSLLRGVGAISIDRGNRKNDIVRAAVSEFAKKESLSIAITPEATRKPVNRWKRGFWEIAKKAGVPIVPTYIDFKKKEIGAFETIWPSDDYEADILKIRSLYRSDMAKHPKDFIEVGTLFKVLGGSLSTFLIFVFYLFRYLIYKIYKLDQILNPIFPFEKILIIYIF